MIEMDKKYRTRDGRDVRLLCVDGPGDYPVIGLIDGKVEPYRWKSTGTAPDRPGHWDLIEVIEPETRTIWVNVYAKGVSPYNSEYGALSNAEDNAIAIAQPVTFEVKRT